jgi:hypothetical protein
MVRVGAQEVAKKYGHMQTTPIAQCGFCMQLAVNSETLVSTQHAVTRKGL